MNQSKQDPFNYTELCVQILAAGSAANDPREFCDTALRAIQRDLSVKTIALIRSDRGQWQCYASAGATDMPDDAAVSEAADRETEIRSDGWLVVPLRLMSARGWLLAIEDRSKEVKEAAAARVGTVFGHLLDWNLERFGNARRLEQLEATLAIAARWHATLDTEELLTEMARTSIELFDSERATIFLWDRKRNRLVGKPALGIEGGQLVVPDDTGIVGKVIQDKAPLRADSSHNAELISRKTDAALNFRTTSLLCVPILSRRGKVLGAFELINKKDGAFSKSDERGLTELAAHAGSAIDNSRMHQELLTTKTQLENEGPPKAHLIGESKAIQEIRQKVSKVAATDLAVLVLGENGTGKEVVSRMIHDQSDRAQKPFIAVNCAALTETLLESELFGHEKGAFTDAKESKAGKFEAATAGTLFLDEVGELSSRAQAKLLRALEQKVITRVGGTDTIATDARIVAATNRDLAEMVREGTFREDLYFRLNVVTIEIPPLRHHKDDVIALMNYFLAQVSAKGNRPMLPLSKEAEKRLESHDWPGNVRELRNLAERVAYLASGDEITVADLGLSSQNVKTGLTLAEATKEFQSQYITQQIAAAGGSMTEAAKRLGLHRSNLYRKMRQLGMQTDE